MRTTREQVSSAGDGPAKRPAPARPRKKSPAPAKAAAGSSSPARTGRSSAVLSVALGSAARRAAVVLEVLGGVRSVSQAAAALGVSVNYYYLLERQAIAGLVAGCAPRPRGKRTAGAEQQVARLEKQLERSRQECQRQAALVRAAERALGLAAVTASTTTAARRAATESPSKRRQQRRPTVRALRAAEALRRQDAATESPAESAAGEKNSSWSLGVPKLEPTSEGVAAAAGSAAEGSC